jgi:2-oxo-4-hydroxy-4-carboxy-5-ureidoimidazoline decarboxylase
MSSPVSIQQVNAYTLEEFLATFGPVFEKSPWVAEAAWPRRPFTGVRELHGIMCRAVAEAGETAQLDLIRAHPDLAGRLAAQGQLTAESTREQKASGLLDLDAARIVGMNELNARYTAQFGFPFIICARLNSVDTILAAFKRRLENDRETEFASALAEIYKIADLRLRDLVKEDEP